MIINSVIAGSGGGGGVHMLTIDNSVENTTVIYSDGNEICEAPFEGANIPDGSLVATICWEGVQFAVTGATTYIEPDQYDEGTFLFAMPAEDAVLSVV